MATIDQRPRRFACRLATGMVGFMVVLISLCATTSSQAADPPPLADTLRGDLGLAVFSQRRPVATDGSGTSLLPYAVLDYKRLFARLDTVGIKTLPVGAGWLELALRVNFDGYRPDAGQLPGIHRRKDAIPVGIGTLQVTPYGAFMLNAFHDVGPSGGQLYEAIWNGRMRAGGFTFYPHAGVDYRSRGYVDYYYGVSASEAAANGRVSSYAPGGAMQPLAGALIEYELNSSMKLVGYARRRWLATSITDSPLVTRRTQDTAFIGIAWKLD